MGMVSWILIISVDSIQTFYGHQVFEISHNLRTKTVITQLQMALAVLATHPGSSYVCVLLYLSYWVCLSSGLQTPILRLNKSKLFASEDFIATCSAPEEKGDLIFRFYQKFRTGEPQLIKKTAPTQNSTETKLVLKKVGDRHLYCDYELTGSGPSNHSNEIQVIVRGD